MRKTYLPISAAVMICFFAALPAFAQIFPTISYEGSAVYEHEARYVETTADGGCVIACATDSGKTWVIRTDERYDTVWTALLDSSSAYFIEEIDGGGFILAGKTVAEQSDALLIKLDQNGSVVWRHAYGDNGNDCANLVTQVGDYFVFIGYLTVAGENKNGWIAKIDDSGQNVQWSQNYGGESDDVFNDLTEITWNGGFAIIGTTASIGAGGKDFWVIKTNDAGQAYFEQAYGGQNDDVGMDIDFNWNGRLILAGSSYNDATHWDGTVMEISWNSGMVVVNTAVGYDADDYITSACRAEDGGVTYLGTTNLQGHRDWWMGECNTLYSWNYSYEKQGDDKTANIARRQDDNYLFSGDFSDSNNTMDPTLAFVPPTILGLSTEVVANSSTHVVGGDTLSYDLVLRNHTSEPFCADLERGLIPLNGQTGALIAYRWGFTLPQDTALTASEIYVIPWWLDPGIYSFVVGLRDGHFITLPTKAYGNVFIEIMENDGENNNLPICRKVQLKVQANPFNPATAMSYRLPAASRVDLSVYDICGRMVAKLIDSQQEAGEHTAVFDGSNLSSGIYFANLQIGKSSDVQKMVLVK